MGLQIGENVVAVLVPSCGGWARVAAYYYFEFWIWWVRGEILVGIHVYACRVIYR